eukprot:TRINITY_DN2594_c0_g1_i12.p1 TRINITY_DN2594_c0_g1~~TRINITY_DN2594_c0_g1_i12.p1  ORF type:complete len:497 (-),score=25.10 TRINITY_DN2594_c0_g1_i12:333-1667(-)
MASNCENVKWMPNTNFLVDGFQFQCTRCKHYFLTHYHSDHTIGITKSFKAGTIYCSEVTAQLLIHDKGLSPLYIKTIPLNTRVSIEGVGVTFMDANHCPGACIILFEITVNGNIKNVLHTGDFRFQSYMSDYEALQGKQINVLFLDTTYSQPRYSFPAQIDAIKSIAFVMMQELRINARTKFLFSSYRIGKERAYLGAAQIAGLQVWVPPQKRRLLDLLDLPLNLKNVLCDNPTSAEVHVASNYEFNSSSWKQKGFQVVGIRATGWEYKKNNQLQPRVWKGMKVYGIPYSEHSSWTELRLCVELLKPQKIVATVSSKDPQKVVALFHDLMDHSSDSAKIEPYLKRQRDEKNTGSFVQDARKKEKGGELSKCQENVRVQNQVIDLSVDSDSEDQVMQQEKSKGQIYELAQVQRKKSYMQPKQQQIITKQKSSGQTSILDYIKRGQ